MPISRNQRQRRSCPDGTVQRYQRRVSICPGNGIVANRFGHASRTRPMDSDSGPCLLKCNSSGVFSENHKKPPTTCPISRTGTFPYLLGRKLFHPPSDVVRVNTTLE